MNKQRLSLENLKQLDFGKVAAAYDHELKHVVRDCLDRPADKRPRTVVIKFAVVPVQPEIGMSDCEEIMVGCEVSSGVPKRRSKIYTMKPIQDGGLAFHPDIPEDADADALFDPPVKADK